MQLATSSKEGPYSLQNNIYVREAYQQQLQMPPSLAELARVHRERRNRNVTMMERELMMESAQVTVLNLIPRMMLSLGMRICP
jgi:hypothetical protein